MYARMSISSSLLYGGSFSFISSMLLNSSNCLLTRKYAIKFFMHFHACEYTKLYLLLSFLMFQLFFVFFFFRVGSCVIFVQKLLLLFIMLMVFYFFEWILYVCYVYMYTSMHSPRNGSALPLELLLVARRGMREERIYVFRIIIIFDSTKFYFDDSKNTKKISVEHHIRTHTTYTGMHKHIDVGRCISMLSFH